MVKVILFGLFDNRLDMERILDDEVEIVGYSDTGALMEDEEGFRRFEYKPFYQVRSFREEQIDYDYILVCNKNRAIYLEIEELLSENGVSREKIVPTYCLGFAESSFQSTYDEYLELGEDFEGAFFGMSYSRRGILPELFDFKCFKFSLNGMDLHAHELYIEHLIKNSLAFRRTRYVIMDIPYYIFNWDICSSNQIYNRMNMYDEFEDWGHFTEREGAEVYIRQWHALKKLVGKKFESTRSSYSNSYMFSEKVKENSKDFQANGAWVKRHPSTIQENRRRFLHICRMLKVIGAKLAIVVFPFSPTFVDRNIDVIERNKKDFYRIMEDAKNILPLEIFDYIERPYAKFLDAFFYNPTHLNLYGAMQMTKSLNQELRKTYHLAKTEPQPISDILYSTCVASVSWMPWVKNGEISGSSGRYLGLRGIRILLKDKKKELKAVYSVSSENSGWSEPATDGASAIGKNGEVIGALRISLEPDAAELYRVRYKVYLANKGWTDWAYDNEIAGESQPGRRIEAVKIELCEKRKDASEEPGSC